jgi:hypothetical protein
MTVVWSYREQGAPIMIRQEIVDGLSTLIARLVNELPAQPPFEEHEWMYVKGIASGELLRLRDRLAQISDLGTVSNPR